MTDVPIGDGLQPVVASEPSLRRVMGPWLLLLFIVGDILGTGIYALTGQVAKHVGGVVWLPFLVAFLVALMTAFSYLELVTKYPQAAGAALYTHKAFGIHFVTFLVAFAVMCSGITSASTASRAFAANFVERRSASTSERRRRHAHRPLLHGGWSRLVNFRGVGESVKLNVLLTCVELAGLLIIIIIGVWAIGAGHGDLSRASRSTPEDSSVFLAVIAGTTLAFFAMVGFEDSVNMAEETKDPSRIFPKVLLTGWPHRPDLRAGVDLGIALVSPEELGEGETPLSRWCRRARRAFRSRSSPFITMFAVANAR